MTDKKYWDNLHVIYKGRDWLDKPTIFAGAALKYFPKSGRLLDLGAGQGQDTRFFADHKFQVVSTDIAQSALQLSESKLSTSQKSLVSFNRVDLQQALPYPDASFDVVYSHLALHYFDRPTTERLFSEIHRVLKPGGVLAFLVNSVHDPEYNTGTKLEDGLFEVEGASKRYFSVESAGQFTRPWFVATVLDDHGETYKDIDKGVHGLVRFIGFKKVTV